MSTAISTDARGSQPGQPRKWMRTVDTMTAAEPMVSARTWRKMPRMFSLSWWWWPWFFDGAGSEGVAGMRGVRGEWPWS